jgi:bifunctional non-homologous end joining protein LigD
VATPLHWDELRNAALDARHYHIGNVFARLGQLDDPWHGMTRHAAGLEPARRRLGRSIFQYRDEPEIKRFRERS